MRTPSGLEDKYPHLGGSKIGQVPHAKKPKSRARGWRDNIFFPVRSLPAYTGGYAVGTMEIEVPAQTPQVFSDITRDKRHLLQLETVLMTVYYPAAPVEKPISRQLWLGRPRVAMAKAYGRTAGMPFNGGLGVPIFLPTLFTKLPAHRNAPLAKHWAAKVSPKSDEDKKVESSQPSTSPAPKFPLILFSHG